MDDYTGRRGATGARPMRQWHHRSAVARAVCWQAFDEYTIKEHMFLGIYTLDFSFFGCSKYLNIIHICRSIFEWGLVQI